MIENRGNYGANKVLNFFGWFVVCSIYGYLRQCSTDYEERGIEVQATIYEVTPGVRRGHQSYTCYYLNEKGERVYAELILNKFNGQVGAVVTGKYLPETPEKVYCKPSKILMIGLMVFVDGLAILLTVFFVLTLLPEKTENSGGDYIRRESTYDRYSVQDSGNEYNDYSQEENKEQVPWSQEPSNDNSNSTTGLKLKL